jgi:hypothetical protein
LLVGDSVSIGYTPTVISALKNLAQVQHGLWDVANGGAGSTKEGLACLENYLVKQHQSNVTWDMIVFNFGLHNMHDGTQQEYGLELQQITQRLSEATTTLVYALTTP